jgi:hypothetical protein
VYAVSTSTEPQQEEDCTEQRCCISEMEWAQKAGSEFHCSVNQARMPEFTIVFQDRVPDWSSLVIRVASSLLRPVLFVNITHPFNIEERPRCVKDFMFNERRFP